MADISGVNIGGTITPYTTGDEYATHNPIYGLGGTRTVADTATRNLITSQRAQEGMLVYVIATGITYRLKTGYADPIIDANWEVFGGGGGAYTFSNGLVDTGGSVTWGGALINDTSITGTNFEVGFNLGFSGNNTDDAVDILMTHDGAGTGNSIALKLGVVQTGVGTKASMRSLWIQAPVVSDVITVLDGIFISDQSDASIGTSRAIRMAGSTIGNAIQWNNDVLLFQNGTGKLSLREASTFQGIDFTVSFMGSEQTIKTVRTTAAGNGPDLVLASADGDDQGGATLRDGGDIFIRPGVGDNAGRTGYLHLPETIYGVDANTPARFNLANQGTNSNDGASFYFSPGDGGSVGSTDGGDFVIITGARVGSGSPGAFKVLTPTGAESFAYDAQNADLTLGVSTGFDLILRTSGAAAYTAMDITQSDAFANAAGTSAFLKLSPVTAQTGSAATYGLWIDVDVSGGLGSGGYVPFRLSNTSGETFSINSPGTVLTQGYGMIFTRTDSDVEILFNPMGGTDLAGNNLRITGQDAGGSGVPRDGGNIHIFAGAGNGVGGDAPGYVAITDDTGGSSPSRIGGAATPNIYDFWVRGNCEITGTTFFADHAETEIREIDASTGSIGAGDYILHVTYTGTGAVTNLVLSAGALAIAGKVVIVKDAGGMAGTNPITVTTAGAEKIDGQDTLVISDNWSSRTIYEEDGDWFTC